MKGFNLPIEYVLHEMSYVNLIMYGAVIPSYSGKHKEKKDEGQEVIKVDDPINRDRVRQILKKFD